MPYYKQMKSMHCPFYWTGYMIQFNLRVYNLEDICDVYAKKRKFMNLKMQNLYLQFILL